MRGERLARTLVAAAVGLPVVALGARIYQAALRPTVVTVHARMAADGGWMPGELTVEVGEPLDLELVSDDVVHGFAVGKMDMPAVDLYPGVPRSLTLTFDRPGTYTYYCTRWCGVDHWRMRGTIVVAGSGQESDTTSAEPLHVTLGLDLDAPHPAPVVPQEPPDARRGRTVLADVVVPGPNWDAWRASVPAAVWQRWRADPKLRHRSDRELWDAVAALWRRAGPDSVVREGAVLYAANCAACHGERGDGRGVLGPALAASLPPSPMESRGSPTDFTDRRTMLGASSALLAAKILRGGMGTGMPNWGAILTDEQVWALVAYLWTFQFADTVVVVEPSPGW